MIFSEDTKHALVTVYGDSPDKDIEKSILAHVTGRDIKLLTPGNFETLDQAAQNSALIFIGISSVQDTNIKLANRLKALEKVAADIIAFRLKDFEMSPVQIMKAGFRASITQEGVHNPAFKEVLEHMVSAGMKKIQDALLQEEHQRVCDALSLAPSSMIVFNAEKRAVFVSDHYFRSYPRIAARLVRGLSVYDTFEFMMKEDGIAHDDLRFDSIQKFWYTLEGQVEYTLDDGSSYRLRAVQLTHKRGTVVIGENISEDQQRTSRIEKKLQDVRSQLVLEKQENLLRQRIIKDIPKEMRTSVEALRANIQNLEQGQWTQGDFKSMKKIAQHLESTLEKIEIYIDKED